MSGQVQPPEVSGTDEDNLRVETSDGWSLALSHVPAVGQPIAVAVLGHAMFCNRRTLDRPPGEGLVSILSGLGIDCWVADMRGHGLSGPRASRSVDYSYDDFIKRDLPALVHFVRARTELPLAVIGHSLTAHASVAACAVNPDLPVDAIVSLAGGVWIPQLEPNAARWAMKRGLLEAWGAVSRRTGYFPARRLGLGSEDEAASYVEQFVINGRADRWASLDGKTDYLAAMGSLEIPILSLVGSADRWMCHPVAARQWLSFAASAPVTHRIVGTQLGDPTHIDHMGIVLDPKMRPIWREIPVWLGRVLGTSG